MPRGKSEGWNRWSGEAKVADDVCVNIKDVVCGRLTD